MFFFALNKNKYLYSILGRYVGTQCVGFVIHSRGTVCLTLSLSTVSVYY